MKLRLLLVLLLAVAASIFVLRWRALRQLRLEGAQLQHRIEQAGDLTNRSPTAGPVGEASRGPALSGEERRELVRLRGEVGVLRSSLADSTNRPAQPARVMAREPTETEPAEPILPRSAIITRMNLGKQWMLALMIHAESNQGRLPASLAEVAGLLAQESGTEESERFELVLEGAWKDVPAPATTIVLREKRPWRSAGDRWGRIYAFADGHVETAQSATEDFTEWEEKRQPKAVPTPTP